jgi:ligand-binding sensor domain-containing protein
MVVVLQQKALFVTNLCQGNTLFFSTNNALQTASPAITSGVHIWISEGGIWLGTEGYGVDWFYPDKNLFNNIQSTSSGEEALPGNWCRAATEDSSGNLWLGLGTGLSCYHLSTGSVLKIILNMADKPQYSLLQFYTFVAN